MTSKSEFNRCTYFLEKKKRTCRLLAKENLKFCGEHSFFSDSEKNNRILCPNDSKHTVSIDSLEDHLKNRCNSRLIPIEYIKYNLNCAKEEENLLDFVGSVSFQQFKEVAEIIEREHEKISFELFASTKKTKQIEEYLQEIGPTLSDNSKKHLIQVSSIIGHIFTILSENKKNCFVEFGSGKAQLSYWLMKIFSDYSFLLIDRTGSRNKFDNRALREDKNLKVKRLRCSIEHLDLSKVNFVKDENQILTPFSKHLCGNATDFGIKCILNAKKCGLNFNGFAFAPCCHHKTLMHEYVGVNYLKSIGIDSLMKFSALRHICTWASCGFGNTNIKSIDNFDKHTPENQQTCVEKNQIFYNQLNHWSIDYKIALGRKTKLLLEYGRVEFLRRCDDIKDVNLFAYVAPEISPENILILGKFK